MANNYSYSRSAIYYNDFRDTLEKLIYDILNLDDTHPDVTIHDNTLANHLIKEKIDLSVFCISEALTYDDALHLLIYMSENVVCNDIICNDVFKDRITYCLNDSILNSIGKCDSKVYWEYISDCIQKWFKCEETVDIFIEYELDEIYDDRYSEMVKYYTSKAFKEGEYNLLTNGRSFYLSFNNPELYNECKQFFFIPILRNV